MATPRIHVVTPIISEGFRDDAPLRAAIPAGCSVTSSFLSRGPASVESAVDEVLAAPGVVDAALAAEADGAAALVIDCMLDPGLEAAREAVGIPVIGCGMAGLSTAASLGRYSIVTVLQRQERLFRPLAARYGVDDALASVRGIGVPVLDLERDRANSVEKTIAAACAARDEDGAEAIVFGCTGMLGFAAPVAEALGWDGTDGARVIDPLPHAVSVALDRARHGAADRAPAPERKAVAGFEGWPALDAAMRPKVTA
jgi:allantoin racemase